jgi:hypothetical protein
VCSLELSVTFRHWRFRHPSEVEKSRPVFGAHARTSGLRKLQSDGFFGTGFILRFADGARSLRFGRDDTQDAVLTAICAAEHQDRTQMVAPIQVVAREPQRRKPDERNY